MFTLKTNWKAAFYSVAGTCFSWQMVKALLECEWIPVQQVFCLPMEKQTLGAWNIWGQSFQIKYSSVFNGQSRVPQSQPLVSTKGLGSQPLKVSACWSFLSPLGSVFKGKASEPACFHHILRRPPSEELPTWAHAAPEQAQPQESTVAIIAAR